MNTKHSNDLKFYIGTSNIVLPVANKRAFPEAYRQSSRLTYYASLMNSLEINSSFYKIPQAITVVKWATEVPEDFRFTFKMHRDVTHNKSGTYDPVLVKYFMQVIDNVAEKKGALLLQFPASIEYNPEYLKSLLALIHRENNGWSVCIEFRHSSWYRAATYQLLQNTNASMVIHDMPNSENLETDFWTDTVYLRYHGPAGGYRGAYDLERLEHDAKNIKSWLEQGKTVYAYFNNTIGNAVFDALTTQELITGKITFNK